MLRTLRRIFSQLSCFIRKFVARITGMLYLYHIAAAVELKE